MKKYMKNMNITRKPYVNCEKNHDPLSLSYIEEAVFSLDFMMGEILGLEDL